MGNCISKINEDHFFAFEEEMKTDILFSKERQEVPLKCVQRGKKYTGVHSIKKFSETFAPLQRGVWWADLF